ASFFPEAAFIKVVAADNQGHQWFTVLRHSSHRNLNHLLSEEDTRTPKNDRLNVLPGLMTAYPNRFIEINETQLETFIQQLKSAKTQQATDAAIATYGISRTSLKFWSFSDSLHEDAKVSEGLYYGIIDYNRLNRH
ncbi:MAG: fatty acid cis/trans isomerase, partial [Sinobacterium sp.]|nr:fatty acid cis/trans isomerase [Sinobacterium sp.]